MSAKALMLQGTGSDVGKSLMVAALCRLAQRRGLKVAPFKPQNMSNNAAVCADGGEIGRAQALQAQAAGVAPSVHMNPVLLKPQSDRTAQIVVQGRVRATRSAADYFGQRHGLLDPVLESFAVLCANHDLVLVEGAGSPAEVNLRARDIANMGFARPAGVPVCLIGDIDKGGVIASLVGTQAVLDAADRALIRGFLINKFRGDPALFDDGVRFLEDSTGWPCCGVIPWLTAAAKLPAEDAVVLDAPANEGNGPNPTQRVLRVAAPMLSRIANFDDADPLRAEPNVDFRWIPPGQSIPRDSDLIILFGTKSTLAELAFLRAQGWDHDIIAHARAGGRVLGLCGGYQMLGQQVHDPLAVDGLAGSAPGLGLLAVETTMAPAKTTGQISGSTHPTTGARVPVQAYEIHVGDSTGPDCARPLFLLGDRAEGATSGDGRIEGTYLHGIFQNDAFRDRWLRQSGLRDPAQRNHNAAVEQALNELADGVAAAVDLDRLFALAEAPCLF